MLAFAVAAFACEPAPSPAPRVADRPARILPASATAVDFATALLEPERIAGLPEQALEYSVLHALEPHFAAIPRFHTYLAEPVLALGPSLVLADAYQAPETSERLRQAGIEVVTLPVIANWSDARRTLLELGTRWKCEVRASGLAEQLDARVTRLGERVRAAPRRSALVYSNFGGVGSSAGAQTTIDEVLTLAGLDNLVARQGRVGHLDLGFEALIAFDPDLIVVSAPLRQPPSAQGDLGGAAERVLLGASALAELRAVRERRIVALPAWLFATGSHEMVRAAEALRDAVDELEMRLAAPLEGKR